MKKEYIKPEMQVYEMETLQLIAASPENLEFKYGKYPEEDNDVIL